MHKLLRRQIERTLGRGQPVPPEVQALIALVDDTYAQADEDRALLERSLDLSSQELLETNARLRADLAERQRAEEALRKSDERFRLAARATSDVVYDYDVAGGHVDWSANFATMFGYAPSAILPDLGFWEAHLHPEDRAATLERTAAFLADPAVEVCILEYRFGRADGTWADVRARLLAVRDANGRPVRAVGAMEDVTDRKKMRLQLVLADRLASLGTLAAGVAHEINNPLAYVVTNLAWATEQLDAAEEGPLDADLRAQLAGALAEAGHGAERVRAIVRDLKVLSRQDDQKHGSLDVQVVVRDALKLAQSEIAARAVLVTELRDVPPVCGNAARLGQVFLNLLVNAAQAIPEGAPDLHRITVVTRSADQGRVAVEVTDTGCGIPEETRTRIFDPFFTTKAVGDGTGLGLAVCNGIVQSYGGSIEIESEAGRGSTFRVLLPSHRPGAESSAPAPDPHAPRDVTPPRRGRIAIVDDEPLIRRATERMLRGEHEVTVHADGRELLALVEAGETWDVVLCDLKMAGLDGRQVFAELSRRAPHIARRVVFVTGGTGCADLAAFLAGVKNPTVEKPFDPADLKHTIRCVMQEG